MPFDRERVRAGLEWRAEALIERLPRPVQVWVHNQRLNERVRRGETSYDRRRLIRTFRELLTMLKAREPGVELGDYLEFGVYHGTSLSCMYGARQELGEAGIRLIGFDSFEGLPESAAQEDDGTWAPGQFKSTLGLTRETLQRFGVPLDQVTLVKGWFSDTATPETRERLGITRVSIAMIDCDLYSSSKEALDFCAPLVGRHAAFVFDDWNADGLAEKGLGQRRAFEECLAEHPSLRAEEVSGLDYKDKADPKIFLVTRS
jgi:hypothetical protein